MPETNSQMYGYGRVSSTDQCLEIQEKALRDAGCSVVRMEKLSGRTRDQREELNTLLQFMRKGDVLTVTRLDRLGRSMHDLVNIDAELRAKGIGLKVIEQSVDTTTNEGRAMFGMLSVFAEFETSLRSERQLEGVAKAKAKGDVYKGRPVTISGDRVRELRADGMRPADIARKLGIGRASVYRHLDGGAHASCVPTVKDPAKVIQ